MTISFLLFTADLRGVLGACGVAAIALLAYVYIGYPLFLGLLSLLSRRKPVEIGHTPSISVLISAYNEAAVIGDKVRQTLALDYPAGKLEVIVVSDGSTDGTDDIVKALRDPRVTLVRVEGRRGKTVAQNEGVRRCRGEVVVFSDATAKYHSQSLLYLAAHYADPRVGAVSGRYRYFDPQDTSPTGLGSATFWSYENLIKLLQSRVATLTGCSGCIYSVRRKYYIPLPPEACSDLVEPLCIVRNGYRVAFEERALAYEETTKNSIDEFRMRVRVGTRGMRGLLSVPQLLNPVRHPWIAFQLLSHKILRWMVSVFLLMVLAGCAANFHVPVFRTLLSLQVLFYCCGLLTLFVPLHKRWRPLGIPLYFCTLNLAAFVSMFQVCRGYKFTTWETVR